MEDRRSWFQNCTISWPLDTITDNELNLLAVYAQATPEEEATLHVLRDPNAYMSIFNKEPDNNIRRTSTLSSDDVALLVAAKTLEVGKECSTLCGAFKVPKKEGKSRLVIDATPVNRCCARPPKMRIKPLKEFIDACLRANFIATVDLVSFFYQIPCPEFVRRNFAICVNRARGRGSPYRLTRLCMGWTWSPAIAQAISNTLVRSAREKANVQRWVFLEAWLDNFVVCTELEDDMVVMKRAIDDVFRQFSVLAHEWKDDEPVLGLAYSPPTHQASHPPEFKAAATEAFNGASRGSVSCATFAAAAGFAMWILTVRFLPVAFVPEIINTLRQVALKARASGWMGPCSVTPGTIGEFEKIKRLDGRAVACLSSPRQPSVYPQGSIATAPSVAYVRKKR